MKLIDLLVQELPKQGGWPEGTGKISMHANGTAYRDGSKWAGGLFGLRCSDGWHRQLPSTYTNAVSREQYEAALAASKQAAWDGDGLPPVGTDCEWLPSGDHDWMKVKVLAYNEDEVWLQPLNGAQSFTVGNPDNFRPTSTEAERKRYEAISAMRESLGHAAGIIEVANIYRAIADGKIPGVKLDDI